jgi:dehydrogenase/reductase SDR family member 4
METNPQHEETGSQRKVALVTGAGRGIGRAVALGLAREGFSLGIVARTLEQLSETREMSGLAPHRALIVLADLASDDAPDNIFDAIMEHYGRIDVLVNNAAFAPARTPLIKISAGDQDRMIAVNLRSPIALSRLAAAQMARQENGGVIINIASNAARLTPAGEAIYAATKAGLAAFTRACFAELRDQRIRVSLITPGLTDTAFIPPNKRLDRASMLRPEAVAAAVIGIINTPSEAAPVEIVIEPARDPMRGGR